MTEEGSKLSLWRLTTVQNLWHSKMQTEMWKEEYNRPEESFHVLETSRFLGY